MDFLPSRQIPEEAQKHGAQVAEAARDPLGERKHGKGEDVTIELAERAAKKIKEAIRVVYKATYLQVCVSRHYMVNLLVCTFNNHSE
jgi:hypothetical protein